MKNKIKKLSIMLILALSMTLLVACGGNADEDADSEETQDDVEATDDDTQDDTDKSINLMSWGGDFIPREVIDEFEEETGIKVNLKESTSNEEMQSQLEANPDQYDLLVITDYMVDILRQNGNIGKLNLLN